MTRIGTTFRTVLLTLTILGLAVVGATPAAADELPAIEGGSEATCDLVAADAYATIDELDAMLPVDPIHEPEVVGRIQVILQRMDHDLRGLGC
jgi:hypothetical protein